jgi:hypothetical protein
MNKLHENPTQLLKEFNLLSRIEPTGINFLTCYLDASGGRWPTQSSFRNMQLNYRNTLSESNKVNFDNAAKMVETYLESIDAKTESIIIFSRGILGGQYFQAIPVSCPLAHRLYFSSKPVVSGLIKSINYHQDKNTMQHWNINLHFDEDAHEDHQLLMLNKHLESDEVSYSMAPDNQEVWPSGMPLALQRKAASNHKINSLNLLA